MFYHCYTIWLIQCTHTCCFHYCRLFLQTSWTLTMRGGLRSWSRRRRPSCGSDRRSTRRRSNTTWRDTSPPATCSSKVGFSHGCSWAQRWMTETNMTSAFVLSFCAAEANASHEGALDQLMVTDSSDQEALDNFLNSSANGAGSISSSLTSGRPLLTWLHYPETMAVILRLLHILSYPVGFSVSATLTCSAYLYLNHIETDPVKWRN